MKNLFTRAADRVRNSDKKVVWKWVCVAGAALMGLVGNILDNKIKDQQFEENMKEEIRERANRITEEATKEG